MESPALFNVIWQCGTSYKVQFNSGWVLDKLQQLKLGLHARILRHCVLQKAATVTSLYLPWLLGCCEKIVAILWFFTHPIEKRKEEQCLYQRGPDFLHFFIFLIGKPSFSRMVRPVDQVPINLFMEEAALSAGSKVLMEVDDNSAPIFVNPKGILG